MINEVKLDSKISGFYKLEAVKYDGTGKEVSRRIAADWFPNLITDQGLNRMGANDNFLQFCQVGTGNTAPANGNTSLVALVGSSNSTGTQTASGGGSPDYWIQVSTPYTFAVGGATGILAEIGIGWSSGAGTLFSRALILDGAGAATTITILSDESLVATYAIRIYPPIVDGTGTFIISGVTYNYTMRAAFAGIFTSFTNDGWGIKSIGISSSFLNGASAYFGSIGLITASPVGTPSEGTVANAAYVNLSLARSATITWGTSATVIGNYKSFKVYINWGVYQMEISPTIAKSTINELKITFTHTWARGPVV